MKKIVFILIALVSVSSLSAQKKKKWDNIVDRTGDHLMLQLTSDHWLGIPDSINDRKKGLSRGLSTYIMLDKRFKGSPQFSVAFGLGVGTSNMYFKNMVIDIKSKANTLPFKQVDSVDHFKKYKLTTAFLEIPLELRFTANPEKESKSIKAAIGVKVGTLLNVHTKGKTLLDKNGRQVNSYTAKETGKGYFNSTRLVATARVGYGNFSLVGSYQLNNIFKDGVAADMKLFQIGLNLSGL
ncbi:MAG TPA: outer membrane beta-barrel protein [Ferruginibacter sp.]|nr:outer membrane beta-barrel protein [Ferruginibacter sp.]